jgi:hypothetical protein
MYSWNWSCKTLVHTDPGHSAQSANPQRTAVERFVGSSDLSQIRTLPQPDPVACIYAPSPPLLPSFVHSQSVNPRSPEVSGVFS